MPNSSEDAPNAAERIMTDFLLARIAEDEQDPWRGAEIIGADRIVGHAEHVALATEQREWEARVLAECEAKRRIVESLTKAIEYDARFLGGPSTTAGAGRRVLNHLASVYADHPDWREEWRP